MLVTDTGHGALIFRRGGEREVMAKKRHLYVVGGMAQGGVVLVVGCQLTDGVADWSHIAALDGAGVAEQHKVLSERNTSAKIYELVERDIKDVK